MKNISHAPFCLDYGRDFGGHSFPWQPWGECDDQWILGFLWFQEFSCMWLVIRLVIRTELGPKLLRKENNPENEYINEILLYKLWLIYDWAENEFFRNKNTLQYLNKTITKAYIVGLKNQSNRSIWGNPTQSWTVDSKPWIPESRHRIPNSLSVELGFRQPWALFRIPKPRITDFTSKNGRGQTTNCSCWKA